MREAKANAPATDEGVALTIASLTDASLAAQSESGTVVSGLDGTVVRIRPQGSYSALSIKSDGSGYHSVVHMYHIGGSSRFKLEKVSSDSDGDYAIACAAMRIVRLRIIIIIGNIDIAHYRSYGSMLHCAL